MALVWHCKPSEVMGEDIVDLLATMELLKLDDAQSHGTAGVPGQDVRDKTKSKIAERKKANGI